MPIVPHFACAEPEPETVICRFLSFEKFRDLFANEELYFCRTDLLREADPQEGLPSEEYARSMLGVTGYDLKDELSLNHHLASDRQFSESYYINCWQLYEGETLHMWKAYGEGVLIFSRFELLREAVHSFLDVVHVGKVRYGEKHRQGLNLLDILFTKRQHFERERELRIVLESFNPLAGMNRHFDMDNFPHREPMDETNSIHKWVHPYKRRRIDLRSVVTELRVSPWATGEQLDEVRLWSRMKNLGTSVEYSELKSSFTPSPDELKI
jgi:hypothetical protein